MNLTEIVVQLGSLQQIKTNLEKPTSVLKIDKDIY
jgi:hypothetical protein